MLTKTLIELVKRFEGFRAQAYQDAVGRWTIGYGFTGPEVVKGLIWTRDQADAALIDRLEKAQAQVKAVVKVTINQNQLDALTSFTYNLGIGSLKQSMLLRCINTSHFEDAATQFHKWTYAGGKVLPGLVTRREAEKALFLAPVGG